MGRAGCPGTRVLWWGLECSWWSGWACHPGLVGERAEMEEAMTGVWELALGGSLPNAGGGRGQGVRREAAMVATPFASHSAMVLPFCGGPCFLHEHSWLWSTLLSFSQVSLHRQDQCPLRVCSANCTFQHPVLVWRACRSVARTICVGLTLSCPPQTSCWACFWVPEAPLLSSPCWRGDSPRCRNLSSPSAPCQGCRFYPASSPLHFPFFFFFVLCGYIEIFLVLLGIWGPLLVLSRWSVRIIPFVDVFLVHLCGEMLSYPHALLPRHLGQSAICKALSMTLGIQQ